MVFQHTLVNSVFHVLTIGLQIPTSTTAGACQGASYLRGSCTSYSHFNSPDKSNRL